MSGYHNINGVPIDWATLQARQRDVMRRRRELGIAQRKPIVKRGYAAPPGTGPEGKTCRDCRFKHSMSHTGAKRWIKCDLRSDTWTNGEGTDILARSPACSKFQPKEPR